jgi:hypothetical protein
MTQTAGRIASSNRAGADAKSFTKRFLSPNESLAAQGQKHAGASKLSLF